MRLYLLLLLSVFIFACAPVIPKETQEDTSLTFKEVVQNPDHFDGKMVLWGGEIIQILPQGNGTTLLEVLEWPLGWNEKPKRTVTFQGRFLVTSNEPLDASRYRSGSEITVAGEVLGSLRGEKIKFLSDPTYGYPLVLSKEIHVWKHHLPEYSEVPDYRATWEYHHYEGVLRY